jgi:hypothetical protein
LVAFFHDHHRPPHVVAHAGASASYLRSMTLNCSSRMFEYSPPAAAAVKFASSNV